MSTILITGSTGFLGRHVTRVFRDLDDHTVIGVSSSDGDLRREETARKLMEEHRPDYIIHLAAKSGGILSNKTFPADYFHDNILILTHCYRAAMEAGVTRMLVPMGGCSYPADAVSPIAEESMWRGYPQIESAGYSIAKKMSLVLTDTYRRQYGFDSVVVVPGNLYGEYDNYHLKESHVIPAMIRKFYEARHTGLSRLSFWGTGAPERDFVYAPDVAALFPYFLFDYTGKSPVNISSGTSTSIRDLADTIARLCDYTGEIVWDDSFPDGQMVKIFSVEKLAALGKNCATPLEEGLSRTVSWFAENYPEGIRL